ncbi:hypothetical protein C0992_006446, partial [Termitomyces sp. T32_za158]
MVLRARGCLGYLGPITQDNRCVPCDLLQENPILRGILLRIDAGVHENSHFVYHGIGGLVKIVRQKAGQVKALQLKRLNDARRLVGKAAALEDYKQFIMAIGSGKVERIDRLVKINMKRKGGIRALLTMLERAARQVYHPKSYTEEDHLRGLLLWRLGGARVIGIANRALDLPSRTTLSRYSIIPTILVSPSYPTMRELETNILSCFEPLHELLVMHHVVHQVLMLDELKIEERPRYDLATNKIIGICHEHGKKTSLEYNSEKEVELLLDAVTKGEVHLAMEATVGAIGVLSEDTHLYGGRAFLVSGSCKRETGAEHPDKKRDWQWRCGRGSSHKVAGQLVMAINPAVCTRNAGKPSYLFESSILMAMGMSILERLSDQNLVVPGIKRSSTFPYREPGGKACFLCEDELIEQKALSTYQCTVCTPAVTLPKSAQRVLEHMAAHILFDSKISQTLEHVWNQRHVIKKKRKSAKGKVSPLVISEAHSSRLALSTTDDNIDDNDSLGDDHNEENVQRDHSDTSPYNSTNEDGVIKQEDSETTDMESDNGEGNEVFEEIADIGNSGDAGNEKFTNGTSTHPGTGEVTGNLRLVNHNSTSTAQEQPPLPLSRHLDAAGTGNEFNIEGPTTRIGRKRKAKDLQSILGD